MDNNYWIYEENFFFKPEFNSLIDNYIDIIKYYKKLIFSNYNNYKICIKTNNKFDFKYRFNCAYSKFNQPLANSLNNLIQLQELTFGHYFNKPLANSLHNLTQLEQLTFGHAFNQPLANSLHNLTKLKQLTLGYAFNQELNIQFNIQILKLDCNNKKIIDNLPNSIVELYLDFNFNLELNNLPNSIKIISFHYYSDYNKELNNLPKSIAELYLPENYDKKIININKNCIISKKIE